MLKLVSVYGMIGENCRNNIISGLEQVKGINKVSITLSNRLVEIDFNEKVVTLGEIKKHIHKLGYDPM